MKNVITEKSNRKSCDIDLMDTKNILKVINDEDQKVAKAVKKALPEIEKAVDLIVDGFLRGGRLAYFGAGTSGRIGVLDASECWPTFSVAGDMVLGFVAGGDYALRNSIEGAEDKIEEAMVDIEKMNPNKNDVVVGVSACGNPKYVLKVLEEAKKRGAKTVGVTSNDKAKLKEFCDVLIVTKVGAEVISGSSRMKSGTAQKMVLNMLSTASMIKIGKTYGNYMIDLQSCCDKLVERANNIIASILKIDVAKADNYRIKANNNIKAACVMYKKQCSYDEAIRLLKQHNGILRKVI